MKPLGDFYTDTRNEAYCLADCPNYCLPEFHMAVVPKLVFTLELPGEVQRQLIPMSHSQP